jgi:hypothetical protein
MESTATVSYNFSDQLSWRQNARQSTLVGEDPLFTNGETGGTTRTNRVNVNFELNKKDPKKFNINFSPRFRFSNGVSSSRNQSVTKDVLGTEINGTDALKSAASRAFQASGYLSGGVRDFGKERRSLTFSLNYNFNRSQGESQEDSRTWYGETVTPRDLRYDNAGGGRMLSGSLSWLEPFGENWGIAAIVSTRWQQRISGKAAFNADGSANDYYSTNSRNDYLTLNQRLQMQYTKEGNQFYFGLTHDQARNEVRMRSLGRDTETGIGEWLHNWAPFVNFRYSSKDGHTISFTYQGSSSQPSAVQINPVLDISNPLEISTGNAYLRPSFRHTGYVNWSYNNRKTLSYLNVYFYGTMTQRGIVSASWFDADGVRYFVPVNNRKPSTSVTSYFTCASPSGRRNA